MLFNKTLTEVPDKLPYNKDSSLQPEARDILTLLQVLNVQIQSPIGYNDPPQIGSPINAILDWPVGTRAGFAAFLRDDVNKLFQDSLRYWAAAHNDPHSPGLENFTEKCICDPNNLHYGYKSWDDFFTRHFRPGIRPLAVPTDDSVIVSAAEATPFAIQRNFQLYDTFWTKGQRYSLRPPARRCEASIQVRRRCRLPGVPQPGQLPQLARALLPAAISDAPR
ncbi:hypothetical protein W97_08042 [Coniosporium apollinis CBS 100218]|uniref:L-tryptophan decarboxylase PsiD-like domain-containing protein n=1 Tax=Coniosporium apollinis (strain CBS 100218) TaxID=1168221 RepID=R7Z439_CONA1|nr:uncharacterized protein W97_08042 [Coniosporium apollinis CBS 100218]EON68784.1 hypothetical protein W97_08042 [Coniosporium apollinis CBS 100218]